MLQSDRAYPEPVVIRCAACGASENADSHVVGGAPRIVCRNCGETWPTASKGKKRRMQARGKGAESGAGQLIDAERRPLISYSSGADKAWAAKVAGDHWPEPRGRSRLPTVAAAMAAALFMAGFFGGREAAVAALPDLAGLYSALRLPVNLDGLIIEELAGERSGSDGRLSVRGVIRNVSATEKPVPPLAASVYDEAMTVAGWRGFDPPARMMAVGEAAPFELQLEGVPPQAGKVVVRFRRPAAGEAAGDGGATAR